MTDPELLEPGPDLAVVIVNYDTGEFLARAVRSAAEAASEARLEIVVVDNASHDDSAERAMAADRHVQLIRNTDNRGFAAAANQGIRASTAPFVFLLNPDAEILAGTFEAFLKVARDRPRAGAIGPIVRDPAGSIYPSARRIPTIGQAVGHSFVGPFAGNRWSRAYTMADWDRQSERAVDWVSASCVLLRRDALNEVGLFDERFFMYVEDVDLCTRLRREDWDVLFSPELEVLHIGGVSTGGYRSRRMVVEHSRSIYKYFVKWRSPGWRATLRPLAWLALRVRAEVVLLRRTQH